MSKNDSFFSVPQQPFATSQGEVKLPIFYYDTSAALLFFWTDHKRASDLLAGTGLQPCKFFNGSALSGLAFYEYRETDIGSYNEVGLATAVYAPDSDKPVINLPEFFRPASRRKIGFYIHHLPVTTEIACAAGKEIWGFPKFTTELPFRLTDNSFSAQVLDPDGKSILSVDGTLNFGLKLPGFDLSLFSKHEEHILRTVVDVNAKFTTALGSGVRVSVGESGHAMAQTLRRMGLQGAVPFITQTTKKFQSRLHKGIMVKSADE